MAKTANLGLPLIAPAQAQKHVTVNDALSRLDALTQIRVLGVSAVNPPAAPLEGSCYIIPPGATGEWADRSKQIALRSNGGWVFLQPIAGWRAWDASGGTTLVFDGVEWVDRAAAISPGGACTISDIVEFDYTVTTGTTHTIAAAIPRSSQVLGLTGRVIETVRGAGLTGWKIGVPGAEGRFGTGLGLSAGSYLLGLSGSPTAYYVDTALVVGAEGGVFSAGVIRMAIHMLRLRPPRPV